MKKTKVNNTGCGAGGGKGKPGFQKGNSCAGGGGKTSKGSAGKAGAGGGSAGGGSVGTLKDGTTAPPPGKPYKPNVEETGPDGVTKAARCGVPADSVPPPPSMKNLKLPNLTKYERQIEEDFSNAYDKDPDGMASNFRDLVVKSTKPGQAPTFGTDDAKVLSEAWASDKLSLEERSQNRATLNLALHQTANAITKRAFLQHLDTMKEGDEIMVTVGGCGAGKGYALKNVPEAGAVKDRSKVVWDSAGDQNATENPWILKEAEKRGLKVNYVYVHADPYTQWAHPERGVVKRAQDPNDGRMVDAHVFADSYAHGAKNHKAFHEKHKDNPNVNFTFLENGNPPKLLKEIPKEAFVNRDDLLKFAMKTVAEQPDIPAHVKRGATVGQRIWGEAELVKNECIGRRELLTMNANQTSDYRKWQNERAARMNAMASMAAAKGYVVKTAIKPPKLNPDGSEA